MVAAVNLLLAGVFRSLPITAPLSHLQVQGLACSRTMHLFT